MSNEPKPLPKSLHTITALIAMAKVLKAHRGITSNELAVEEAVAEFGLTERPDAHGLAAYSVKMMDAEDKRVA